MEDLRIRETEYFHACRLQFYSDKLLDTEAVFPHVLYSERGMPVARLMGLDETTDRIYVRVHWRGLPRSEDTLEPILKAYEDAPALMKNLLSRKSLPRALVPREKSALSLS